MSTNTFVSAANLAYYDSLLKGVAVGAASIEGRTITLKAVNGTVVGTVEIPQAVYNLSSSTQQGLMSAAQYVKLEGIAEGATKTEASGTNGVLKINGTAVNVYIHPTGAALTSGIYKIATDANGHITTGVAVTKADLVALGLPAQDTTYNKATANADGLMSKEDFAKLEDVSEGATAVAGSTTNGNIIIDGTETKVYRHATHTALTSGLYKVTVDGEGHVVAAAAATKADITALGIPGQDTTYTDATASKSGLMSAAHFTKVEGIAAGAQVNVLEKVSVNGTALAINSKGVNIDLSSYALKTDVASAVNYRGSVDTYADLPASPATGDMYNVVAADAANGIDAGVNVVWNGTGWDAMAPMITITGISNAEIDALFA